MSNIKWLIGYELKAQIGLDIKLISGQKIKYIRVFFSETKGPLFSVNSS